MRFGRRYAFASGVIALTGNVVPMSGPENRRKTPSGDHTGSRDCSRSKGAGGRPSSGTLKRYATPPSSAAVVIDRPSGAQAAAPCHSSDLATRRPPSALAASDVYLSMPELSRWGMRLSTSTLRRDSAALNYPCTGSRQSSASGRGDRIRSCIARESVRCGVERPERDGSRPRIQSFRPRGRACDPHA